MTISKHLILGLLLAASMAKTSAIALSASVEQSGNNLTLHLAPSDFDAEAVRADYFFSDTGSAPTFVLSQNTPFLLFTLTAPVTGPGSTVFSVAGIHTLRADLFNTDGEKISEVSTTYNVPDGGATLGLVGLGLLGLFISRQR